MSVLKLGFITSYLSDFMISGFTCAAALHVLTSQISKLLGIQKLGTLPNSVNRLIMTYVEIGYNFYQLNWLTTALSTVCIILLLIGKYINQKFKKSLSFPIPWEVFMVTIATVLSNLFLKQNSVGYSTFNSTLTVVENEVNSVIGGWFDPTTESCHDVVDCIQIIKDKSTIPPKLPKPDLNHIMWNKEQLISMLPDAAIIGLVNYFIAISLSRLFASYHNYYIEPDTELRAFGLSNMISSCFGCFPCSASMSRSVLNEEVGVNTQVSAVFSTAILCLVLMYLGPYFESLPIFILAVIIIVNLKRLILDTGSVVDLWRSSKPDAVVWIITYLSVIILGVSYGLVIGIVCCCMSAIVRGRHAVGVSLEPVAGVWVDATAYKNTSAYKDNPSLPPGILVFRFLGPIFFANKERFTEQLVRYLQFDPATINKNRVKIEKLIKKSIAVESHIRRNSKIVLPNGEKIKGSTAVNFMPNFVADGGSTRSNFSHQAASIKGVTAFCIARLFHTRSQFDKINRDIGALTLFFS